MIRSLLKRFRRRSTRRFHPFLPLEVRLNMPTRLPLCGAYLPSPKDIFSKIQPR